MNKNFQKILTELYKLEPNFKKHEKELIKIIEEFKKSKPKSKFTKKFEQELREKIIQKINEIEAEKSKKPSNYGIFGKFLTPFSYVLTGFLLALIFYPIFFSTENPKSNKTIEGKLPEEELATEIPQDNIITLDNDAFGEIRTETALNGLGGANKTAFTKNTNTEMNMAADSIIAPPFTNYKYSFKGNLPLPNADKMLVYKPINNLPENILSTEIIQNLQLNLIDLENLPNLQLQTLVFKENKEFGHIINIDLQNGFITIDENYEKWPNSFENCHDDLCYEKLQLKIEDIPSGEKLINIADKFLQEYKISTKNYAEPIVQNFSQYYSRDYIPDIITVIYPLKIDEKTVYDQSGNIYGLNVGINIRQLKVSSIYNLRNLDFEKSLYEIETDEEILQEYIKKGGLNNYFAYTDYDNKDIKTETIELKNPEIIYILNRSYQDNGYQDLFMPAIALSFQEKPEYYYTDKIIVPLIKEIIENQTNSNIPTPSFDAISSRAY